MTEKVKRSNSCGLCIYFPGYQVMAVQFNPTVFNILPRLTEFSSQFTKVMFQYHATLLTLGFYY